MRIKINPALILIIYTCIILAGCKKHIDSSDPPPPPPPPPPEKTNIILILIDDFGYEIPASNGGESYETPNLDAMAAKGMRFTQCHSAPLCSPSRFMLLTGKYNFRNYTTWGQMDTHQKTIANMLHDAGYATCVAGKWQLDGGERSIHTFGFDAYAVWNPIAHDHGSRYKSPTVYENGNYLPAGETENKYGDDIFTDYALNFIDSNYKQKSFFIYLPFCLTHAPFSPTPDDPEFENWHVGSPSDTLFFPSMVKYVDKKIGQVMQKLKDLGIEKKTIVLVTGDNGTSRQITSDFDGEEEEGGKTLTTEAGTHVPLLAYAPGLVPNSVNTDLIDFTDFLPTLAGIAEIQLPQTYGTLDGVSFYPRLKGATGSPRNWIFCYYAPHPEQGDIPIRYAQNINYKYYDDGRFYDIASDILEQYPIPDSTLTADEMQAKNQLNQVLSELH